MKLNKAGLPVLAMLLAALLLWAQPLRAADPPAAGAEQAQAAGDAAQGAAAGAEDAQAEAGHGDNVGMPQLDVSHFASQIFWLVLCFGTLLWLLTKKGIPRISEILETRQERLDADLDRAATLRAEAEEASRTYDEVVHKAQVDAQARIKAAQDAVSAEIAKRQAQFDADTAKKVRDAEAGIDAAKSKALSEVAGVAAEIVEVAVERLSGIKVGTEDANAAVSRLLAGAKA